MNEKIKEEIKPREKWKWKHDDPKPMEQSKSSFLAIHAYHKKQTHKTSNKQWNCTVKWTGFPVQLN